MDIEILQLIDGARKARGCAVIIDVLRAFSVSCYVYANGAKTIIPVGDIKAAYSLKQENPDHILIGEVSGEKPEGFDYGNSPTEIEGIDFSGKSVIQSTSSGTPGIAGATQADEILAGCFLNVQAIIDHISNKKPEHVSLVCMGWAGVRPAVEDTLCAEYIRNALQGRPNSFDGIVSKLKNSESMQSYLDPAKTWKPLTDFDLCMQLDKFDFVLKAEKDDRGVLQLVKSDA
jgi:2-phosphosulfolactate phosphatase